MIELEEVIKIHEILIERFGGSKGIRDIGLLQSAINRPFQTFDNKELYPSALEKAAALIESVVLNHPFTDGNKRTGYVLMRIVLLENGFDIKASQDEKYDFVCAIANGTIKIEEIKGWLSEHIQPKE